MARTRTKLTRRDMLKATGGLAALAPLSTYAHAGIPSRGAPRPTTFAQTDSELEPAQLRFYFGANPEEANTRQRIIDAFMERHPQIEIQPQIAEGNVVQELQVQFAGGAGPDVMMAWELTYSGLAERGIYANLDEFIQDDPDFAPIFETEYVPELLDMFRWNDQQFVLPEQFAGVVLFYNKALFEEAGVDPPPADWEDETWTYDRFLETAQALTREENGRITQFGYADAWWPPLSAMVWATTNGGDWFDEYVNPQQSTITDPNITEGVQFYADLANVHRVAPTFEETETQSGADMFMGGRAAMVLVGHWYYPAFSQVDGLEFDVGVLPAGPNGTTPMTDLGSTGLSISATTEYPEQAWEFVKFASGPEGQHLIAESGLFVPVLRSVGESESFLASHEKIENTQVFIDAMDHSIPLPITPVWNEISDTWERETTTILRGEATAADVHASLEPQINELLERG